MSARRDTRVASDKSWTLDDIVAELAAIRENSQTRRCPGRSPPELPSREAVVAIVTGLVAALFPRHFGSPGLSADDVDLFVADTLDHALRTLRQQVRRELHLSDAGDPLGQSEIDRMALEMVHDFAQDLPPIRALLDSDIRAAFDGDPAALDAITDDRLKRPVTEFLRLLLQNNRYVLKR